MKVLFATDLSEPVAVTRTIEDLVTRLEADLLVLHVMPVRPVAPVGPIDPMTGLGGFSPYALYDPELEADAEAAETNAFQAFLLERFQQPVKPALREGDFADVILEDAETQAVDLLILGKHHHSRLERLLLGSVTREVAQRAKCPTLLIPIQEEEQAASK